MADRSINWERAAPLLAIIGGMILLLLPAIVNRFPLIFPDTSDYIILTPRLYRSPVYQFWVFATGWKWSLWLTVAAQALVVSMTCLILIRIETGMSSMRCLAALAILCVFSAVPVVTSFVMPDVFTGVALVCIYLLLFRSAGLSPFLTAFLFVVGVISVSAHLSHLTLSLATAVLSFTLLFRLITRRPWQRGVILVASVFALSASLTLIYNKVVFHRLALGPAGSTFLMANLIAEGPALHELQATCPRVPYLLCPHLDKLHGTADDLLWNNGIIMRTGGFPAFEADAAKLDHATLLHRPGEVVAASLANSARALITVNATAEVDRNQAFVDRLIRLVYGDRTERAYQSARQSSGGYPRRLGSMLAYIGLAGSLLTIAWGALVARRDLTFAVFAMIAYLCNAIVCASVSGVHDRYQNRVSWLIVAAAVTIIAARMRRPAAQGFPYSSDDPIAG